MKDFEHLPGTGAELLPDTLHEAQAEIVQLRYYLQLALRQWRMYAGEEARLYNATLQAVRQREGERFD